MKWMVIALIFLISCAPATQEVVTKPLVEKQAEVPKTVVVPEVKEPTKAPSMPVIQPTPIPESRPQLSPEQECIQNCETSCTQTAQNACTQRERAKCKDMCDDNPIIDPSACTQACAYLGQPNVCKQQMEQFCSAQCVGYCH